MFHSKPRTRLLAMPLLEFLLLAPLLVACAGSPAASSLGAVTSDQVASPTVATVSATAEAQRSPSAMSTAESASTELEIPDTPAGRHIDAWLKAFNSGDQAQLQRFFEENLVPSDEFPPEPMAARMVEIYKQSGPVVLKRIEEATETEVTFVLQQQISTSLIRFTFVLEPQPPHRITEIVDPVHVAPSDQAGNGKNLSDEQIRKRVEDYLRKLAQDDAFWGVVLVAKDGVPLVQQGYGMANLETQTPNGIETVFPLASLGKMFTSVAIGQLMEQGKLRLDDPISAYLPDYPKEVADKVRIRDLMNHESGIPDFFFVDPEKYGEVWNSRNPHRDFIQIIADKPLEFEPGSRYNYSNSNYLLLGAILERVSGQSYYDYINEHIFEPAGMHDTFWDPETVSAERLARPHSIFGPDGKQTPGQRYVQPATGMPLPSGQPHPPTGGAWGGNYATASDMLKFFTALRQHTLLSKEYSNLLFTGSTDGQSTNGNRAYGFVNKAFNGASLIGYTGATPGTINYAFMYPRGYDIIIMTNGDTPPAGVTELLDNLLLS